MISFSVNSGSNGNCIYVESDDVRLLLDAGVSGLRTASRLAGHGRDVAAVRAVIISHDHADHIRCAGVLARKFRLPVYMTRAVFAVCERYALGPIPDVYFFRPGQTLTFGHVSVATCPTPHDAADPVSFVISDGRRRLGILTDLGRVFERLPRVLSRLDAVFLESNYDPQMLAAGPYPPALKRRIAGGAGHLSNVQAGELVRDHADGRLQWVCLAHLSQVNNTPEIALGTHLEIAGRGRPVHVAGRHAPGSLLRIE
jgi:phosphoribosyl 1,2-cyclic phosphodiesterase